MKKLLLMWLLVASAPASATLVTIDADSYQAGTDISTVFSGVTLSSIAYQGSGNYVIGSVVAEESYRATTGTNVFGNGTGFGGWNDSFAPDCMLTQRACGFAGANAMLIEFATLTDYVAIQGNWISDGASIWLYDENRVRIGSCDSVFGYASTACYRPLGPNSSGYGSNWELSFTSLTANVKYVLASGQAAGVGLDALSYNSVPEPGMLALFGVGMLGLFLGRRQRQ